MFDCNAAFTCISYAYNVQKQCYTVQRQGNMVNGKDDIIKRHLLASHIPAQWIVAK